jgi:hypothetical protein
MMKILEYFDHPVQYQALNKRQYYGITPHWFSQIRQRRLSIRLTDTKGVLDHSLRIKLKNDIEFPKKDYIEGLSNEQRKALRITGVLRNDWGGWKFLLSNGEQFTVDDRKYDGNEFIMVD